MGKRVLIIGAGGVGRVVAHKCAKATEAFSEIAIASRTLERVERLVASLPRRALARRVDADQPDQVAALVRELKPDIVIHVALPYQDLAIMDGCLQERCDYLDTANYEPPDVPRFEYRWQWAYDERYRTAGLTAILGCGFDPGVTNAFTAYARKHLLDRIRTLDIYDCNAGSHGKAFATNFNPEINLREVTAKGRYWEHGRWVETEPLSISEDFDYPEVGPRKSYLMFHEELESLVKHFPEIERARFWMTFSDSYLEHLRVLGNVGMLRVDPVRFQGVDIVPLQFLKALLPDPSSLAENYTGKTSIGVLVEGEKNGRTKRYFLYNVCDHAACYREVGAQAVSYTTGVPAVAGAMMVLEGLWKRPGVWNVEQLDPDPFLARIASMGLPWHVQER
ncbi:MAG: saccharopine dehydrogenase family protein [Myxococcales bacterium]|nr:saccharopine dehydrogenase family protein [Myxococcales bacterium]